MLVHQIYIILTEYPPSPAVSGQIKHFRTFIEKNMNLFDLEKIDHTRSVPLDVSTIMNDTDLKNAWSSFDTDLFEKPDFTLRLLEYCLHEVGIEYNHLRGNLCKFGKLFQLTIFYFFQCLKCESRIRVRIYNHQPVIPLSNLKVNYFGKC